MKLRSGDIPELKQWLKRRDNWLSNHIQNEIVDLLGNAVLEKVVATVKNKEFYSCLADGTQDVTTQEQLSVVFRVVNDQFQAYDIFAGFVSLNATDGQTIATSLKNITFQLGIDFKKCRGLGFDGASNMSGALQGAQALLRREYPFAHYFHCANHRLDLVLQEVAREERLVRDALELARKTANFVKESHKRLQEYKRVCRHSKFRGNGSKRKYASILFKPRYYLSDKMGSPRKWNQFHPKKSPGPFDCFSENCE